MTTKMVLMKLATAQLRRYGNNCQRTMRSRLSPENHARLTKSRSRSESATERTWRAQNGQRRLPLGQRRQKDQQRQARNDDQPVHQEGQDPVGQPATVARNQTGS